MTDPKRLRGLPATQLTASRVALHRAAQWPSRAARANLAAVPDDSHSNLTWLAKTASLASHELAPGRAVRILLELARGALHLRDGDRTETFRMAGRTDQEIGNWVDEQLSAAGLKPASPIDLPYELPDAPTTYPVAGAGYDTLGAWYAVAEPALLRVADRLERFQPGPSPVRCWPHHFDIATLCALDTGDPETARSIGIGMSPGDSSYDEPYFYVTPWPHLDPAALPEVPPHGGWHTSGFVSMIATGSHLAAEADAPAAIEQFLDRAVATAIDALGGNA